MKRLKIMGLCVVAVFAVGLLGAGIASAVTYPLTSLPELGRCVKLSSKTGQYQYPTCVAKSEGSKGSFEWEPGPGEKSGLLAEAGEVKLETVGGVRVGCASAEVTGNWADGKTATVNVALRGCESKGKNCGANPGKPNEITTEGSPLEGEIGFIEKGEKPKVGLDLKPKSPATALFTFTCGGPPELTTPEPWTVEGSIIGRFRYANHMKLTFGLLYTEANGKQIPQKFESGLKDTPLANRVTEAGPVSEEAGLLLREEEKRKWIPGEFEEKLEIKAK